MRRVLVRRRPRRRRGLGQVDPFNPRARDEIQAFFSRPDSFALGVCNGCQMMSALHELIPGTEAWPRFVKNRSQQFEARLVMVEVPESPSLFFEGMAGSRIPVVTAHGEGPEGIIGKEFQDGAVAFFDLQAGLKLAIWERKSISHDSGLPLGSSSSTEFTLGHNVASMAEVDEVMKQAERAGALIVKPAQDTFWGGYAGYFLDPDFHLWEAFGIPSWSWKN